MSIPLVGESGHGAPFSRSFFNVQLEGLVARAGAGATVRVTLSLSDGSSIDVCSIEELHEEYIVLRGHRAGEEACDTTMHAIPYPLIYRVEIDPSGPPEPRLGFFVRRDLADVEGEPRAD